MGSFAIVIFTIGSHFDLHDIFISFMKNNLRNYKTSKSDKVMFDTIFGKAKTSVFAGNPTLPSKTPQP